MGGNVITVKEIDAFFVQSWYDDDGKKHTPLPVKNNSRYNKENILGSM